ncbi:hypothetical protein BDAP_000967 [Binucleata daphniae]
MYKETEILKNRIDFLKEYIELVDNCIICVQHSLQCSLKNDAFDPKNPNACHIIRPINYENRNNAVIRYTKLNHYKKTKSGTYNQNNKNLSDAMLAYDHNHYVHTIDKKFRDIIQRLTEDILQDHCYTNHDVKHVITNSNDTAVSDATNEQKTAQTTSTTKQENTTTEKNIDLHGASDSVAKKCFAIVLMSTLLLRLFNY